MYSSGKFLSPITTAGLPTPGPLVAGVSVPPVVEVGAAAAELLAAEVVVLDVVVELELDEPHAASPAASAIVSRARRPRRTCDLLMLPPSVFVVMEVRLPLERMPAACVPRCGS